MSTKLPRLSSKHAKSVKCKVNLCNLARNYFANVTSLSKNYYRHDENTGIFNDFILLMIASSVKTVVNFLKK